MKDDLEWAKQLNEIVGSFSQEELTMFNKRQSFISKSGFKVTCENDRVSMTDMQIVKSEEATEKVSKLLRIILPIILVLTVIVLLFAFIDI